MARLKDKYANELAPALQVKLGVKNKMLVPRLQKVVINMGFGIVEKDVQKSIIDDLTKLTGQKPVLCKARKSISNFKLREGMVIGAKVTLRGERMFDFVERLVNSALPRIRDFRGVSSKSFDGRGNYSMGVREQIIFPEIDYDKIEKNKGMNITIVTTAKTDAEARFLLKMMGVPFKQ